MSEIINLISDNGDAHVYSKAVELLSKRLKDDYSFILNVWNHEMPKKTKHKRVLISTSDESHKMPVEESSNDYVHIFKQYQPMLNPKDPSLIITSNKVTAIPLCELEGVEDNQVPILEREYDWSWMGQFDPYTRGPFKMAIDELESDSRFSNKVVWYNGWNNGESIENYSSAVNQTKIMPIPCGSCSLESFRFFEAMKCGCIPVCLHQPMVNFYNVAPYFTAPSWAHLKGFLEEMLKKEEDMIFLSEQCRSWHRYFCSPEGLSEYMYRAMKRNNNV
jgi:hypothetical protein